MLQSYNTKSLHIQDNGLFIELALTLAPFFGRVTYSTPWIGGFPSSSDVEIGEGYAEFDRVDGVEEVKDETDLFIFPDTYYSHAQIDLLDAGKRVFGSRDADALEIDRSEIKPYFDELGISQGPYELLKGISALRKYLDGLQGKKKVWVKIDKTRGDLETFCVESYALAKNQIDELEFRLGPVAETKVFTVEDHLADTRDIAIDTYCIDGDYPGIALLGTEDKGESYVCARKKWKEMPENLVAIYDDLSFTLGEHQYRNFLSLESRMKEKKVYLGDPCCRFGSPPAELQFNMIKNLPDIFWFGAEGKMVEPDIPDKYGVELIVHSDWANTKPLLVEFPKKYRDRIKFRYCSEFDGKMWIMPQNKGPRIAAIVSSGDSIDGCMEECKEISEQLKGIQVETFVRGFPIMKEHLEEFKSWGVSF